METNEERKWCVYIHRNMINNKAYIGITCRENPNKRWCNGIGYKKNKHFWNAIQKYGWDNFEHIIFEVGLTSSNAKHIEKLLIEFFNTTNPLYGYNQSTGGEGSCGIKRSEEFKKHLSKIKTGQIVSELSKEKNRKAHLGKKASEESKRKRSLNSMGNKNPFYGKHHSEESKKKQSIAKQSMYIGAKSPNAVPCYCIELNEIFLASIDANKKYGIPSQHICDVCNGKRKTCGKHPLTGERLHWKTIDDAINNKYITKEDYEQLINQSQNILTKSENSDIVSTVQNE